MTHFDLPIKTLPTLEEAYGSVLGGSRMENTETIVNLPTASLLPFPSHPFLLQEQRVQDLVSSIQEQGILSPLMVRESKEQPGKYEILAGHHRQAAALEAGLDTLPCVIRNISDDEAICFVVDSNLQRGFTDMLPSEIATALTMKHDAMKHQGKRLPDQDTPCHSDKKLAEESLMSPRKVNRYIRIGRFLIKPLLEHLDQNQFPLLAAEQLSYLSPDHQELLSCYLDEIPEKISIDQSLLLRELENQEETWNRQFLDEFFHPVSPIHKPVKTVKLKIKSIRSLIPESLGTQEEVEQYIVKALAFFQEQASF